MDKDNIMHQDTVALDPETEELVILDQTRLPGQTVFLRLSTAEAIYQAIYTLQVRGAPAIGVAAAIGIYAVCRRMPDTDYETFAAEFERIRAYLVSARPTAVNLAWALEQMAQVVREHTGCPVPALKDRLRERALELRDQDIQVCRAIGEYGLTLIQNGDGILTHCNAGQLATVRYGTALAPIHVGREQGMQFRVFTDETRPLLQGARLSAYELFADGVDTTLTIWPPRSCAGDGCRPCLWAVTGWRPTAIPPTRSAPPAWPSWQSTMESPSMSVRPCPPST